MKAERFNELINGPLHHPFPMFVMTRLARCLFFVVNECGSAGEDAIERFCRDQDESDRIKSGEEEVHNER